MAAELPALSASAVDYGDAWGAYSGHPPPAAAALAVPGAKRARGRAQGSKKHMDKYQRLAGSAPAPLPTVMAYEITEQPPSTTYEAPVAAVRHRC